MTLVGARLPICVDLDGTLVSTDTLHESLLIVLRNSQALLRLPLWVVRGRAYLKQRVAECATIDPSVLPYNTDLLDYLRQQRALGRFVLLATASDRRMAEAVAAHVGLFDEVVASDGSRNLKGTEKARALVCAIRGGELRLCGR